MAAPEGRRNIAEWLAVAAAVALLVGAAAFQGWLWRIDAALYDASLALRSRLVPDDVVIVGIDDASLARLGRWPWRRSVHAALVDRLAAAGAKAVATDLILAEPDTRHPEDDAALARALAGHGSVLLPVLPDREQGEVLPIAPLAQAAAGFGHITRLTDADGIVRRAEPWKGMGGVARPHLALALLGLTDPARYRAVAGGKPVLIPFAGPPGSYRHLSYADVLEGRVATAELDGKVVLVGATATGLSDNFPTPVSVGGYDMPGIEIHATLYDALRQNLRLTAAPPWKVAAASVLSLLLLLAALRRSSPHLGLLIAAGHGLLWLAGPLAALAAAGVWLPPAAALAGTALAYPLWSWRRLAAAQHAMARGLDALEAELGRPATLPAGGGDDPFARQMDQVQAAIERLREARQSRDQALQFLSHDLRSPLASILALLEGPNPDPARLASHARGALALADDFTRLAKARALDPARFSPADLTAVADEALDDAWAAARAKDIGLKREFAVDEAPLLGDASLLKRAAYNLIDNAIRYSPAGSPVTVRLAAAPGAWVLEVIDQGYGIAAADLPRLFAPFARVRLPDQPEAPGSGLGLAMVKATAAGHGGEIAVESAPGAGSRFILRIPAGARNE